MKNIAINGFGRIGRAALKIALTKKNLKVVAINDLTDTSTLAHLLKYDSIYGRYGKNVSCSADYLSVDNNKIVAMAEKNPAVLPWKKLCVDVVLECTGVFRDKISATEHLKAGAKKVIISAPPKDEETKNIVLGVNERDYNRKKDHIISCASCTTNCLAPVVKILHQNFTVKKGLANTIHSYTADQNLIDGPHKDLRRSRAATLSIVPTSTGSAIAVTAVIPELKGKLDAIAYRVPTPCASVVEFVAEVGKNITAEEINAVFLKASRRELKGILAVSSEEMVSVDFIGDPHSAIIDLKLTKVIDGNLIKVVAWYDNEWGYSNRLVELAGKI